MGYHVLVVDDDPFQCKTIQLTIEKMLKYRVSTLTSGREAASFLISEAGNDIDLVILDLSMPEFDGMQVLEEVTKHKPELPIIINTAFGDVKKAIKAVKMGAVDFIEKQDGPERLKLSIENVKLISKLNKEVKKLHGYNKNKFNFEDIIGKSRALQSAINLAKRGTQSNIPLLLFGESGVGKELFARAIHSNSIRCDKPFVAVNCAAIPENLVESILFGHEKGAFTGAIEKSLGKFREADGGTIFLDEIGELPLEIQAKLLRALQNFEVEPVGLGKTVDINVRIITATNKNLEKMVAEGKFREDLLYRINVFPVQVPTLRERREDIPKLVEHFVEKFCLREKRNILYVDPKLTEILSEYWWPGNIRQLENAVYRAVVMCSHDSLNLSDFDNILMAIGSNAAKNSDKIPENFGYTDEKEPKFKAISEYEKDVIQKALDFYNYNISKVSKVLEIGRSTLYRKMKEYGIEMQGNIEEIEEFRKTKNGEK